MEKGYQIEGGGVERLLWWSFWHGGAGGTVTVFQIYATYILFYAMLHQQLCNRMENHYTNKRNSYHDVVTSWYESCAWVKNILG